MMDHEVPMSFFHCVGEGQAWRIIIGHAIVIGVYLYIAAFRFAVYAMHAKTRGAAIAWWSLTVVFPFCALCGYGTTILAGWYPEWAYPLKEYMGYVDGAACLVFLRATERLDMEVVGGAEN